MIWLVTYGDLVTVLLVFFVMLQIISEISQEKFNELFDKELEIEVPTETLQVKDLKALELLKEADDPEMIMKVLDQLVNSKEVLVHLKSIT